MKIYYDNQWIIERDDDTVISLTMNEASMLYDKMQRARIWDEVAIRYEDDPRWGDIEDAMDDILDELMYEDDNETGDRVHNAVSRWVDLNEEDGVKTYRVCAKNIAYYYIDVQAEDEKKAWQLAAKAPVNEFIDICDGEFELTDEVEEI